MRFLVLSLLVVSGCVSQRANVRSTIQENLAECLSTARGQRQEMVCMQWSWATCRAHALELTCGEFTPKYAP